MMIFSSSTHLIRVLAVMSDAGEQADMMIPIVEVYRIETRIVEGCRKLKEHMHAHIYIYMQDCQQEI